MSEKNTEIENESSYKDVFRNKEFVKLLTGQLFSNIGDAVFRIAIVLYVYSLTGSAAQMTLVLAAQRATHSSFTTRNLIAISLLIFNYLSESQK